MTMKLSTAIQKAFEYGLLHVILVASSYYYFGLLKGIIALVILYQAVKFTGKKFGYDICVGNDVIHMFDTDKVPHNCTLVFELEKVKFDEIKEKMYSTVIHHIKRYRQIPVNYLGFYFWKEVDKNIAKNQIKICEAEIKSKDDILQYTQKLLGTKLDRDKPQWELIYIENFTEATSLCFFKFHHSFTDGAGVINSMMFLNSTDRISQEMFKGRGLPFYIKFLNGLLYPICLLICSFELWKHNWKGHDMIQTKSGENSGESICILSKTYKLNDIKRCYKRFDKTTMNNFMMGLAAKSIHRWYQLNGVEEPKDISTIIPVVMKPFSPNIDELNIENCSAGVTFRLQLKENLEQAIKLAKKGFNFYFKLPILIHIMIMLKAFGIFPNALGRYLYNFSCWNLDMTLSNVQGGNSPLYLCNKEIISISGFLAPFCRCNLNFTYNSYRENVFVQITADKYLQMDPKQLMEIFEQNLDEQIQQQ